jgi:hypothetical protein
LARGPVWLLSPFAEGDEAAQNKFEVFIGFLHLRFCEAAVLPLPFFGEFWINTRFAFALFWSITF